MSSSTSRTAPFPLTVLEAHAFIRSYVLHGLAHSHLADRSSIEESDAHYNYLAGKILNENTMQRTLRPIPSVAHETHDERNRDTFRRKSYPGPSKSTSEPLC